MYFFVFHLKSGIYEWILMLQRFLTFVISHIPLLSSVSLSQKTCIQYRFFAIFYDKVGDLIDENVFGVLGPLFFFQQHCWTMSYSNIDKRSEYDRHRLVLASQAFSWKNSFWGKYDGLLSPLSFLCSSDFSYFGFVLAFRCHCLLWFLMVY